ncbi:hypothetical protein [Raoultella planticola]|uniref:hypothetical protein n=1 Tax=Raoultella planticola TaxID=575 RepID=UPI0036D5677D
MNLSFKKSLTLKMTALSVIFFVFPTACSVYAQSQSDSEIDAIDSSIDSAFNLTDARMDIVSSPIIIGVSNDDGLIKCENEGLLKCESTPNHFHKSLLLRKENSLANHYQLQAPTTSQEIFNVIKVPENGPEWVSIIISIIALASSFGVPYWQHQKERKEAINEGYWIREVIMPKINGLAFDVTAAFKNAVPLAQDLFIDALSNNLFPKLGELRDSLYLFNSFTLLNEDVEILESICDDLEQKVSDHIDEPNEIRIADISKFHSLLINKLIEMHRKIG